MILSNGPIYVQTWLILVYIEYVEEGDVCHGML